ncbi:hypothetical protein ACZ91_19590 [Streptomyces regensis]|nr:hypothetical protein ACZ91_19590 [Streptomyces regensis]
MGKFRRWRQDRAVRRVQPGDGRPLKRFRWWQFLSRAMLHLYLNVDGRQVVYTVDVRHGKQQDSGRVKADLYLDGLHHAEAELPARFPVPGGIIDVQVSAFGLKRCHFVPGTEHGEGGEYGGDGEGGEYQLSPDPATAEGRRMRFDIAHPTASRVVGALSVVVLVCSLFVVLSQIAAQLTKVPFVAEHIGVFGAPVHLPAWLNVALTAIAAAASVERATRLRYSRLLDGSVG